MNDFTLLNDAISRLAEAPIYIDDSPGLTSLQIRTKARRLMAEAKIELIVIDYLQMIMPSNSYAPAVQQYTEVSRAIKSLARELEVPVLVLSQLSRSVEQRQPPVPKISDLRETGSIEQDADVVMLIYRDDRYNKNSANPNIAEIAIAKHRNGPVGQIELYFNQEITSFRELDKTFSGVESEGEYEQLTPPEVSFSGPIDTTGEEAEFLGEDEIM